MISFRQKKCVVQDLMPEAIDYLTQEKIPFTKIKATEADAVSKVNSKAMVLVSFVQNEYGKYQIQVQDKELYRYTQKLLKDIFRMNILDIDKKTRVITAECDQKGIALDIIDILGRKYNLSIVC